MQIQLLVTLDVEPCDPAAYTLTREVAETAATQAVRHAIRYGEGEGHVHDRADDVSIILVDVVPKEDHSHVE